MRQRQLDHRFDVLPEEAAVSGRYTTSEIAEGVIDYLKMMADLKRSIHPTLPDGWVYLGLEEFLLQHGRFWTPRQLPSHLPHMTPKMCFENAYKLATRRRELRYVEGIAIGIIPIHHAWCVDADDNVIDPTWASTSTDVGSAYFGTPFDLVTVKRIRSRECLCVLGNWINPDIFTQPFQSV